MQPNTQSVQAPSPIQILLSTVSRAMNKVERKIEVRDDLDRAGLLLETLPLSTEEFRLASNLL